MRVSDASAVMAATGEGGGAETPKPGRRICVLTSNFPRWEGDSTTPFVLHLAQDLMAEGWEVEVLAPHAPGAAGHEILGRVAVTRFRYLWPEAAESVCYQGGALINLRRNPLNWLKLPALVAAEAIALWRLARRRRYDLIHAHWILPQGFVGVLVGRSLGIPCLITVHGGDIFALGGRLLGAFKRYALTRAAAVTVNSSATEAAVRAVAPDIAELSRIPMGARVPGPPDADALREIRARYAPGGAPLLVFVGRLVAEKGVGDLLRALALLHGEGLGAHAMFLGEGQERARFEALAAELGLAEAVHFLGWIAPEAVPAYLAAADVFVAPSKTGRDGWMEGQGLTIVEALLGGTPVIATRTGGIVDLISNRKSGLLVDQSAPGEIAAAIGEIIDNRGLADELATAGREDALRRFTREGTARAFSDLYRWLVKVRSADSSQYNTPG
jgi:glycosyltransferase involved in cell wall biosynthesis